MPHRSRHIVATLLFALLLSACAVCSTQNAPPANTQELMASGLRAIHQNQSAQAEEFFRQALAIDPALPDAYLGLGMAALRLGDPVGAKDSLSHALTINENLRGAHMFLGIAQYQSNDFSAAVDSLQKELILQPQSAEVLTWIGIVELAAGHPELATGPLDQAAALNPKNPEILDYRGRAHTQVAQQSFQQLYDMDPASWHVHRALGEMFSAARQPEQAIEEYNAALGEQLNNPDLYEAIGNELQRAGRPADAIQAYQKELKLNPRSGVALFSLGKLYVQSDHPADGIPLLRQSLDEHVPPAPAYYYIGVGLAYSADNKSAAEALEACLANNPSPQIEKDAWYALVRLYPKLNRPADAQHALDEFKKLQAASERNQPSKPTKQ
ncbi:MAG TPA: tetratricopeptide repeat protein [Terracidiphilus sp.]|jgi:tetratricopeptide (TPR) repeat protein